VWECWECIHKLESEIRDARLAYTDVNLRVEVAHN
jgi:hypothetical protein